MCPYCSKLHVLTGEIINCSCGRKLKVTRRDDGIIDVDIAEDEGSIIIAGRKNDSGKPPISLLDRDFIEGTANVMAFGAKKYDRYNWCGGIAHTRLVDAAMRHLVAYASGEDLDPESGLPHIDHAAASINMLRGNQRLHPELDDRYNNERANR